MNDTGRAWRALYEATRERCAQAEGDLASTVDTLFEMRKLGGEAETLATNALIEYRERIESRVSPYEAVSP